MTTTMTDAAAPATAAAAPLDADNTLPKRLREAWHKTVGTYATEEQGTQSLLQRLVDFGHLSAEEAKKVLAEAQKRSKRTRASSIAASTRRSRAPSSASPSTKK
jgi:hypothetical protein